MKHPNRNDLKTARWASLVLQPATPASQEFTKAAMALMVPHLARVRPLGPKGLPRWAANVGTVLAGVMRPGLAGVPVRVHQSQSGDMWERMGAAPPIGRDRYWAILDAMKAAGLVGIEPSVNIPGPNGDGRVRTGAAVWPTDVLEALAAARGLSADTRKADWRVDPTIRAMPGTYRDVELVTCRRPDWGTRPPDLEAMGPELASLSRGVRAINTVNEAADIRGAGQSVTLARRFLHSLGFHGRFYAPYTMAPEDRLRITINGEPVAEVDVRASQLTVLLGITGHRQAPEDAYAVSGIPRAVVKAWAIQSLGSGKPVGQWAAGKGLGSGFKARAVWKALQPAYPFFEHLPALVPTLLMDGIPDAARNVAAGQWVVQREAAIIARAMSDLSRAGVVVLPVHDSLVVPVSAEGMARDALIEAFKDLAGIEPRLTVDRGGTLDADPLPSQKMPGEGPEQASVSLCHA